MNIWSQFKHIAYHTYIFLDIKAFFGELFELYPSKSFILILLHTVPLYLMGFMPMRMSYVVLPPYMQSFHHLNYWYRIFDFSPMQVMDSFELLTFFTPPSKWILNQLPWLNYPNPNSENELLFNPSNVLNCWCAIHYMKSLVLC